MKWALIVLLAFAASAQGRTPDNLEALDREMKIIEDVFASAVRNSVGDAVRITDVEAEYLANQGVLISLSINQSWLSSRRDLIEIDPGHGEDIVIHIPEVVRGILDDLDISVAPYEPEELAELRNLRDEQRENRQDQRSVRAKLREMRRKRATDDDDDIDDDIEALQRELRGLEVEYEALETDIDAQYERLRSARSIHSRRRDEAEQGSKMDLESALMDATCDYGATLKSLPRDEHLSLRVQRRRDDVFYVFEFDDVIACQRDSISTSELKERAFIYER